MGTVQTTRTSDANVATSRPSNPKETMGTVGGKGPPKQQQAGKLGPPALSATTSNSSLASVGADNASLTEPAHRIDTVRGHGSMSTSEMEMRRRRAAEERHARDYEERLHERVKEEDRHREETDRRYAERIARNEEELARANERADAERR